MREGGREGGKEGRREVGREEGCTTSTSFPVYGELPAWSACPPSTQSIV